MEKNIYMVADVNTSYAHFLVGCDQNFEINLMIKYKILNIVFLYEK